MSRLVAVDIGGTKIAGAVIGADGRPSSPLQRPTPARAGRDAILDAVAEVVAEVADGGAVDALGVATAGTVDVTRGVVIGATDSLAGWCGTDVAGELAGRLGIARMRVHVENDVHAHALGEAAHGGHGEAETMAFVAVGTGVGGGLVEHGVVRRGARHAAGSVAHIPVPAAAGLRCGCGRLGHVEAIASGTGMHAAWLAAGGEPSVADARGIVALAETGHALAVDVLERSAAGLAQAIAGVVTTVDPEVVVVGGGLAQAGDRWWDAVLRVLRAELVDELQGIRVERSSLGAAAALAGAGLAAKRLLEDRP